MILKLCSTPGCGRLTPHPRCDRHQQERRTRRDHRPIQYIYSSRRWRNDTRPAVLARDGHACVYCGTRADLTVAHLGSTQAMLARGADVYDPRNSVTTCRAHNHLAARGAPGGRGYLENDQAPESARAKYPREKV